jgi:hypothetical protein
MNPRGRIDWARTLRKVAQERRKEIVRQMLTSMTERLANRRCADGPDEPSPFRQFGHTFVTTMPRPVSEGEMSAVDDAVSGTRLERCAT